MKIGDPVNRVLPASRSPRPVVVRPPVKRKLHGRLVEEIGRRIVQGVWRPGDILVHDENFAAELGGSRTAYRESLKVLAGKGLIEARPKTGTRVRPRQFWNHLDPDILAWRLDGDLHDEGRELFELRRVVEPGAAEIAASRATPAQVAELEACYRQMEAVSDDDEQLIGPDLAFHQAILRMTGNEMLGSLAALIETALIASFRLSIGNPAGQRPSLPLHYAVLQAISDHDPARARAAMIVLLDGAENDVRAASSARRRTRSRDRS